MLNLLAVGFGGFIGSVFRYLIGGLVQSLVRHTTFLYGTLTANVLGCLLIGLLSGLTYERINLNSHTRLFLFTGVLGGFTTFSTFSLDTFTMLNTAPTPSILLALIHVVAQLALGLLAVYLGYWLAQSH